MTSGIRATVEFPGRVCPIADLSATADATVDSIATSVCPGDAAECVTEFAVPTRLDDDDLASLGAEVTRIFSHGETDRYRLVHDDLACPCEQLGRLGTPPARYVAREGRLTVVFHATDYEDLQEIVADLRAAFPEVDIKKFVRAPAGGESRDSVLVDRSALTARQVEVLETAYEMGYFERPREHNATEVAAELDISPATFREHLAAAQSKVLEDLL